MRALFHRGRHRVVNKYSRTVADLKESLDAEQATIAERDRQRRVADLVLAGHWSEVWGTGR
ncbi:hypothetical protein PBI_TERROR_37 [Mycobacterium phage Terror]|uniref:Uncharacterized protein n=1 Tax=Mycobacterium phage Taheera TaxID=1897549 RepID=A0A1D8EVS3_9CAUD|nr:hypothetical protein KDW70_gp37 [Mycobacterium phage Taheera]AOT25148.1 hypothetical protein PBI_TAHEERA_37 [Mycobacterium phage Taheera]AOT25207.1 hypothetical protein PBI_TERROR_37 [Mycobacterium phage Terror]